LTEAGRREFRELAQLLGPSLRLRGIVTSPLVRAVQTAEILADAAEVSEVAVRAALHAERGTGQSVAELARELGVGWAMVGHNPSLAEGLAVILGLSEEPRFRKGAIAALRLGGGGKWTLDWVVSPGKKQRREF
jgi:phosphohistidine phosphatase